MTAVQEMEWVHSYNLEACTGQLGQKKTWGIVSKIGSFRVNSTNASSMTTSEFDEIFRK